MSLRRTTWVAWFAFAALTTACEAVPYQAPVSIQAPLAAYEEAEGAAVYYETYDEYAAYTDPAATADAATDPAAYEPEPYDPEPYADPEYAPEDTMTVAGELRPEVNVTAVSINNGRCNVAANGESFEVPIGPPVSVSGPGYNWKLYSSSQSIGTLQCSNGAYNVCINTGKQPNCIGHLNNDGNLTCIACPPEA